MNNMRYFLFFLAIFINSITMAQTLILNDILKETQNYKWLELHTTNEDEITINGLISKNNADFIIDWGDGTVERVSSSISLNKTHTYGSLYTGNVRIRTVYSNVFDELDRFHSSAGHWDFNLSVFEPFDDIDRLFLIGNSMTITGNLSSVSCVSDYLYLNGSSMTITGNLSSVSGVAYYLYLNGSSMTITGNLSSVSGVANDLYLIGNSMTITGNLSSVSGVANSLFLIGSSMTISYNTTTWAEIPTSIIYLRLQVGDLSATEVDQLLIDLDASGDTGTSTIDLRGNNAAPTAASASAITSLQGKGYTVLTN